MLFRVFFGVVSTHRERLSNAVQWFEMKMKNENEKLDMCEKTKERKDRNGNVPCPKACSATSEVSETLKRNGGLLQALWERQERTPSGVGNQGSSSATRPARSPAQCQQRRAAINESCNFKAATTKTCVLIARRRVEGFRISRHLLLDVVGVGIVVAHGLRLGSLALLLRLVGLELLESALAHARLHLQVLQGRHSEDNEATILSWYSSRPSLDLR